MSPSGAPQSECGALRKCAVCGATFEPLTKRQSSCSAQCKRKYKAAQSANRRRAWLESLTPERREAVRLRTLETDRERYRKKRGK